MAANFPEIWNGRVIDNLKKAIVATWLEGISEMAADVVTINGGTLTEKQKIYVAATDFDVDVLINNSTYPIEVQEYEDGTIEITLDKFQTKATSLADDDTLGASYDKIDTVTKSHTSAILDNKFNKSLHAIAPSANTADTPVIQATGGPEALEDAAGRKLLTYEDLIEAKRKCGWKGARLVLTNDHWNDLALDRKRFGDQLVNYKSGNPAPVIAGFELHKFDDGIHPLYTAAGVKKAFGAIKEAGDTESSVIFAKSAIAKKTGATKQYFSKAENNPLTQSNLLNYRHYFIATPYQAKKIGAIR
ncbi:MULTISPECIES: hypothetical protein [Bizionia]|uniref:Uncharacterized protein n=1 Tax=Bizionia algoritergicola TaxID=291187 RepID=A0A5D0QZA4_9FLAO|nr:MULTISPECIES: hypothetical protein [Bizionia]OBX20974.1 hypothetical protein BAA08_14610 [Bizionia sp. APA-3]TYB74582.1 hypothetical protein ES675_00110 [Bizionia algoritergicola]